MRIGDVEHENPDRAIRIRIVRSGQRDVQIGVPPALPPVLSERGLRASRTVLSERRADQEQADRQDKRIGYSRQVGDTISSALMVMRCSPGSLINKPRTYTFWLL